MSEYIFFIKINYLKRIWPIYALITLSMAFVFAHLGEGPMWSRTDIAKRCSNNWPENIFFVKILF